MRMFRAKTSMSVWQVFIVTLIWIVLLLSRNLKWDILTITVPLALMTGCACYWFVDRLLGLNVLLIISMLCLIGGPIYWHCRHDTWMDPSFAGALFGNLLLVCELLYGVGNERNNRK
jgi:hypothetical protein